MPDSKEISKVLVIGAGPNVIGQGSELDSACCAALAVFKSCGFETVVVDSNSKSYATMTTQADKSYIEPLTDEFLARIIELEKPDAIYVGAGGRKAANLAASLMSKGAIEDISPGLVGINAESLSIANDCHLFTDAMNAAGVVLCESRIVRSLDDGMRAVEKLDFPVVVKPSYPASDISSFAAYNMEEYVNILSLAIKTSWSGVVLVEEMLSGVREVEVLALRDESGGVQMLGCVENLDTVGVHSGDSISVFGQMTLSDTENDALKKATELAANACKCAGELSIRYAISEDNGPILIGLTCGATRLSALVSAATKVSVPTLSARLAVGEKLSDISSETKKIADFTENNVCVRAPRFSYPATDAESDTLDIRMHSTGDSIGVGSTFIEALQKSLAGLDCGYSGLTRLSGDIELDDLRDKLVRPHPERIFAIRKALESGMDSTAISKITSINQLFIDEIKGLIDFERELAEKTLVSIPTEDFKKARSMGYTDAHIAAICETGEDQVRMRRKVLGLGVYADQSIKDEKTEKKVLVVGSGPHRTGQGPEFDICAIEACLTLKRMGYETILVTSNPALYTVIPGISDNIHIAPVTAENVIDIALSEQVMGVVLQFAAHTGMGLTRHIVDAGIEILAPLPEEVGDSRERSRFWSRLNVTGLERVKVVWASTVENVLQSSKDIGFPMLVRIEEKWREPKKEIVYDKDGLEEVLTQFEDSPTLSVEMRTFLEDAIEIAVDAITDGDKTTVCGIMEHIEEAGVHSGDCAFSMPPYALSESIIKEIKAQTYLVADALGTRGLFNVKFALKDNKLIVLDVGPFASRTISFTSRQTGVSWSSAAMRIMLGEPLADQGLLTLPEAERISVKEAVFPYSRYPGAEISLGPEMKSIGEVVGMDADFGHAYMKAQKAAGQHLPSQGTVFLSVANRDKESIVDIGRLLHGLGFRIAATRGTARTLNQSGLEAEVVPKIGEGRPDATDLVINNRIHLIINTLSGRKPRVHEKKIRMTAVERGIPIITTVAGAKATLRGMAESRDKAPDVSCLTPYSI